MAACGIRHSAGQGGKQDGRVRQALDGVMANPAAYARSILLTVVVIAALIALFKVGPRLWRAIEEVFFTNWQLAMLGTAAIVLSLAGGWTTWDGMTNFTGEPVLSLMFTFGIHGVMLIVAWLIGESFATGMSTVPRAGIARVTAPLIVVIARRRRAAGRRLVPSTSGTTASSRLLDPGADRRRRCCSACLACSPPSPAPTSSPPTRKRCASWPRTRCCG